MSAGISRRKLLASGALASASLSCRGRSAKDAPAITPRFVGQDPARGHLLRSGALLDRPIAARERTGVVIVGAGAAGLSAAWRLAKAGVEDFVIVELEAAIGGTARSGALPRSAHPMGAHYLPTPPRECSELLELLTDIGLLVGREHDGTAEYRTTAICAAPEERHFIDGQWFPGLYPAAGQTAAEADQWARLWAELDQLDRARDASGELMFRLPVRRSAGAMRELDRISMAAWLDARGYDSWRLRWYVDYACRDDYGCTAAQTSAFAGLHHFLARGLEHNREGALLTWAGGNGELLELIRAEIARRVDLDLRTDHAVVRVDAEAGRVRVHDFAAARTLELEADAVLWAAPRFILPHVLGDPSADPLPRGGLSYAPWLVANLELSQAPAGVGAGLAWDNVPVIRDPARRNLGYVVATHQEGRAAQIEPGAVISYYQPLVADDAEGLAARRATMLASDASQLGEAVLAAIEPMHPGVRGWLRALDIHRWGHAMIRPTPGHLFGPALAAAREPIGRVRACATDVGGLPLFEEAFYAAIEAADWAHARLS